jgi:predicted metal-dependent hydrolase
MEQPIRDLLGSVKPPLLRLAATCAIEHITAIFSILTLGRAEMFEGAHPDFRRLWMWHALEELEHKAVALDVYNHAASGMPAWKRYGLRVGAMNKTIFFFTRFHLANMKRMLVEGGAKPGWRLNLRILHVALFRPGFFGRSLPLFLRYYLPGYDPRQSNDQVLIRKGRAWLAASYSGAAGVAE